MLTEAAFILLATLAAQSSSLQYDTKMVDLKPGQMTVLESINYPHSAPGDLRQTWMINTLPGAVIKLVCTDLRLFQMTPCGDYALVVSDAQKVDEICGARFNYNRVSAEQRLAVGLRTGPMGRGYLRCNVEAYWKKDLPATTPNPEEGKWSHLKIQSDELPDSSEHGGPRGKKSNTCECGWANKKLGRIFGGKEAYVNEFPFIAGIVRRGYKTIFCGSSIITPYHALTAAHCLYNKTEYGPFDVVVGEHDVLSDIETDATEQIYIRKYILHKHYSPVNYVNDIALLVLDKKITFSKRVGPVCLPNGPLNLEKEFIKIIGWGRTPEKKFGSPVLQKVDLRVLPKSLCAKIRPGFVPDGSPNQLCTYGKEKSACSGDSGGPLVWIDPETNRYTLIGIVSYGTKECGNKMPRVSTDVTMYVKWIQDNLAANGPREATCSKRS